MSKQTTTEARGAMAPRDVATDELKAQVAAPAEFIETPTHQVVPYEYKPEIELDEGNPDNIVVNRPDFLSDEESAQIEAEAAKLVETILANPSDVEVTSTLYSLGGTAMDTNAIQTDLIDQKIGPVLETIEVGSPTEKGLVEIKSAFDLINPHTVGGQEVELETQVEKAKFMFKVFGTRLVNEIVSRLPIGDEEVMAVINSRRDSVKDMISGLKAHLLTEKDSALKNAIALGQMANELYGTQEELQKAAYQGQLIWQGLNEARVSETDPGRDQALTYLTNDLAVLVLDIQGVDQLNLQSRLGAETLINNCRQIEQLVNRIVRRLLPSVQNALAVKAAGAQQARLAQASHETMSAANQVMLQTSKDIRGVTVKLAEMNAKGLVDIDALEEAANEYDQMRAELEVIMKTTEENARGVSNRMSEVNNRVRRHADPMTKARQAREKAGLST